MVVDVEENGGHETVVRIGKAGGEALFRRADVSKAADCEAMVKAAEERFGRLDVLFNNAGIMHAEDGDAEGQRVKMKLAT